MRPEDIRRLYQRESAATDAEARAIHEEIRTDPDAARAMLQTFYALAGEDPDVGSVLTLVLRVGLMQLLVERAAQDDTFALRMGELILEGMEAIKPRSRVPRGKPARSA